MQTGKSPAVTARRRPAPDLPGCRTTTIRLSEISTYEGRFELWDADTETAWVMRDPTGFAHEGPSQRPAGLSQCRSTRSPHRVLRDDRPDSAQQTG